MKWLRRPVEDTPPGWLSPTVTAIRQLGALPSVASLAERHMIAIEADEIPIPSIRAQSREIIRVSWSVKGEGVYLVFGSDGSVRVMRFATGGGGDTQLVVSGVWQGVPRQSFNLVRDSIRWLFRHANASQVVEIEQAASLGGLDIGD